MARTTNAPPPGNDSALVERPQTWQDFATCCGRLVLWEQTATGRQRVSPVGLPHVCTTQGREQPTPSQGRTEEGVAALLRGSDTNPNSEASIAQHGEETSPQTTTPPLGMSQTGARSTQQITQQEYSTGGF